MIEDAVLREISVNWFPATNSQVREMATELLKARAVVRAAQKIRGHTPYCLATKVLKEDQKCRCGSDSLHAALEEMDKTINP